MSTEEEIIALHFIVAYNLGFVIRADQVTISIEKVVIIFNILMRDFSTYGEIDLESTKYQSNFEENK